MNSALLIFSKAPIAGYAKRRLIPVLGEEGAAQLQERMTERMVEEATAAEVGSVMLYCAPDGRHPFFQKLAHCYPISLRNQKGEELGVRMSNAIRDALEQDDAVILCGSDSIALGRHHFIQVQDELQQVEVVLIPALDGGYLLVAMCRWIPQVFEQVEWGSDRVLAQTIERLKYMKVSWKVLDPLADIDLPEDLDSLPLEWQTGV